MEEVKIKHSKGLYAYYYKKKMQVLIKGLISH